MESLKIELEEFLVEKNQIYNTNIRVNFRGIHKNQVDENLKNGIYVFNNGSTHSLSFFVIVDNNSYSILDVSKFKGLKDSIERTLEFSKKQDYCTEIIKDYVSRMVNVYFTVNKNPRSRLNKNCEFDLKPTKSSYELKALRLKLAEFLVDQKKIKNIEHYFKYDRLLMLQTFGFYYGISKKENVDCGVYSFYYFNAKNDQNLYYLIVHEDWLEIFEIEKFERLYNGINKILDFAENHKYCHLKTEQIINQLIEQKFPESCLGNSTFELP